MSDITRNIFVSDNMPKTIYITIGNTDNKLTQQEWADFCEAVYSAIADATPYIVGAWYSLPSAPYQNACWAFSQKVFDEDDKDRLAVLRQRLGILAGKFKQDDIVWAVASVDFLTPIPYVEKEE